MKLRQLHHNVKEGNWILKTSARKSKNVRYQTVPFDIEIPTPIIGYF